MDLNEKQIQILQVAEKLFAHHGFEGTSIREISREAGVNIAMVSYYFGSKEKLMEAIFHYRVNTAWFGVQEILGDTSRDAWEKMKILFGSFIEKINEKKYFHQIVVRQQLLGEAGPVGEMMDEVRCRNFGILEQLVKEGQQAGLFKPEVDVALMIVTMVGVSYQLMHLEHFYRKISHLENMTQEAYDTELRIRLKNHLETLFKSILFK